MISAAALCGILTLPVAWNQRELISPDGVSYIEIATNALRLSPSYLISNAYWSPGYPALIALALRLTHGSLSSELAVVHGLDWLICLFAYASFTCFLHYLLRWIEFRHGPVFARARTFAGIVSISYALLLASNLDPSVWTAGPDVLVEGVVFLAAGMCIRVSLPGVKLVHYAVLGLVLAIAYVAKAALFPLSIILLVGLFIRPVAPGGRKGLAVAAVSFLVAASPLVVSLSRAMRSATFGDSGKLNYEWFVANMSPADFWTRHSPGAGVPLHPPKIVSADPWIVKLDDGPPSSFPYWYDPSPWWDGVKVRFDWRSQIRAYRGSLGLAPPSWAVENIFGIGKRWLPLFAGLGIMALLGARWAGAWRCIETHAWLIWWPASAFLTFASVLLEFRYILPFVVLGWTAIFVAVAVATEHRWASAAMLAVAAVVLLSSSWAFASPAARFVLERTHLITPSPYRIFSHVGIARDIEQLGIRPGDHLATVGFPLNAYFAHLVGGRIDIWVMESPQVVAKASAEKTALLLSRLRANGAKAVVSLGTGFINDTGWVHIAHSNIYIRLL